MISCRPNCGACCIALSISSAIPGMPDGKPAGMKCIHLEVDNRCDLFGSNERPEVCEQLIPMLDTCGTNRDEAMLLIHDLEQATRPNLLYKDRAAPT